MIELINDLMTWPSTAFKTADRSTNDCMPYSVEVKMSRTRDVLSLRAYAIDTNTEWVPWMKPT